METKETAVPTAVLEAFGLVGAALEPFDRGLVNQTWAAGVDGRTVVLRRHSSFVSRESVEWEHQLLAYVAGQGWPVPAPLPALDATTILEHDGRRWSIAPLLPGVPGPVESVAQFHIQGRLLGRLHQDMEKFPVVEQRPGLGKTWELDAWVSPAGSSFNELVAAFAVEYPDVAGLIRRQRYRSLRELARLRYPDLPDRPVHGDFQRYNLLWHEGQVTGVLDFDQARHDAQLCDLAVALMPFMPLDLAHARALLEGYETVRPLGDDEWALLPALVRASLLRWVAYCLARWRASGGAPDPIIRTMTVRFPAFEQFEPSLSTLPARSR